MTRRLDVESAAIASLIAVFLAVFGIVTLAVPIVALVWYGLLGLTVLLVWWRAEV